MADAADGDTGNEVEILIAIDVDDGAALSVVHRDLREQRDRLQTGRHRFDLPIENRLGFWAGYDAALPDAALAAVNCT